MPTKLPAKIQSELDRELDQRPFPSALARPGGPEGSQGGDASLDDLRAKTTPKKKVRTPA